MSLNSNLNEDDFKIVPFRRKGRKSKINPEENCSSSREKDIEIDKFDTFRRLEAAKEEISSSDLFSSTLASLRESLELLGNPELKEIICLGLGHIGERMIPRYQLALLLCIKNIYSATVYIHDPIFHDTEKEILKELGLNVLDENQEGKYKAKSNFATLFFLPHCPKQLTNNLLWFNWSLNLKNCILIANSFTKLIEESTKRSLNENAEYISNIFPYTIELPIINTFKYFEVFNDTAIHIFPSNKLNLIPSDFWDDRFEPQYKSESVEYITNKFVNIKL